MNKRKRKQKGRERQPAQPAPITRAAVHPAPAPVAVARAYGISKPLNGTQRLAAPHTPPQGRVVRRKLIPVNVADWARRAGMVTVSATGKEILRDTNLRNYLFRERYARNTGRKKMTPYQTLVKIAEAHPGGAVTVEELERRVSAGSYVAAGAGGRGHKGALAEQ